MLGKCASQHQILLRCLSGNVVHQGKNLAHSPCELSIRAAVKAATRRTLRATNSGRADIASIRPFWIAFERDERLGSAR